MPEAAAGGGPSESENTAPLGGLREARLTIRSGLSSLRLRSGTSPTELYRAAFQGATPQVRLRDGRVLVQYRNAPFDWRKRSAVLDLNDTIPWSVEIVGGVQKVEADMRSIDLRQFDLTGGVERLQLELGPPHADSTIRIVGGAVTVRIERPSRVPVKLTVVGGSAQVTIDGTALGGKAGKASTESRGWAGATNRYTFEVVGGSKSLEIVGRD
jgi:hypothetical protein